MLKVDRRSCGVYDTKSWRRPEKTLFNCNGTTPDTYYLFIANRGPNFN